MIKDWIVSRIVQVQLLARRYRLVGESELLRCHYDSTHIDEHSCTEPSLEVVHTPLYTIAEVPNLLVGVAQYGHVDLGSGQLQLKHQVHRELL